MNGAPIARGLSDLRRARTAARWILLVCLLGAPGAQAKEAGNEGGEIDYVALAAKLLQDDHLDRAADALAQVDLKQEGLDLQRYQSLRGIISLKQRDFPTAREAFQKALKLTRDDPVKKPDRAQTIATLSLYLAQVHFGMKDHEAALATINRAWKSLREEPNAYLIRAQSAWELKQPELALEVLKAGNARFEEIDDFGRLSIFYLIELGLFQEVQRLSAQHLSRGSTAPMDYLSVGEALRRGKRLDDAVVILESGHLRFPKDDQLLLALAHTYMDLDRPLSAALVLEEAARLEPKYTVEAAELYRRAGRLERALSLNARVEDQKAKIKQRMSILLQQERFELVAAMKPALSRLGVLQDDDAVRYGLAYALYKVGEFRGAEQQLKAVRDRKIFDDGNELRRAMERCRATGWECI